MKKSITITLVFSFFAFFLFNACNTGKLVGVPDPDQVEYDKTRIVVLLKGRVTPEMLVTSFEKYGLIKDGPANRTLNEWIFSWVAKVGPEILLEDIRNSSMVEKADFVRLQQQNN